METTENLAKALILTQRVLALALMQDKDKGEVDELIDAALVVVQRAEEGDEHAVELVNAACAGVDEVMAAIANRKAN